MENTQMYQNNTQLKSLPNSTAVLILGILSIVGCWCYGLFSIIFSIIALVLAKKDLELYRSNPSLYISSSYGNLKAGKICALIGLIGGGAYILFVIVYFIIYGAFFAIQESGGF